MNTRKRFIINCLKTIEMLVTLELCREMQIYELAYASNQQTPLPSLQNDMIRLRRLIKTLELFNAIVKNALTLLKEHPALLPGLVPIVMFTTNMLPIDPAINQDMQKKFIRWISQDLFIAKQNKNIRCQLQSLYANAIRFLYDTFYQRSFAKFKLTIRSF
jgi:hypothetical protein